MPWLGWMDEWTVGWGVGVCGVWEFTLGGFTRRGPDVRQGAIETAFALEMHGLAVGRESLYGLFQHTYIHA